MNRTTLSLAVTAAALAAVTGVATLTVPDGTTDDAAPVAAARLPVERTTLMCPSPGPSEIASTTYTALTPDGQDAGKGTARLTAADGTDATSTDTKDKDKAKAKDEKPVAEPTKPGKPVTATTSKTDAPALIADAHDGLAPGFTVQQTTVVDAGAGRGILGARCTAPDTEFWFPGVSTNKDRQDYVYLTNPDDTQAVVDVALYGKEGLIRNEDGDDIPVPAHGSTSVLLSTLTEEPTDILTLRVTARSGRVGAAVLAADDKLGGDWIQPAADPAPRLVLPGIPKDATSVRLVAFAPGDADAELGIRYSGPTGQITPAGNESLTVKSGMTASADFEGLTAGEGGSLILTPAEGTEAPVVAGLRVTRGKGDSAETAFIPATEGIGERATAAGSWAAAEKDEVTTLSLVAPDEAVQVKVTSSAGSKGGTAAEKTYTVKSGTTLTLTELPLPEGKLTGSRFAFTVEKVEGGELYAARMLQQKKDGVPMFTVQTLPDDHATVAVPETRQDISLVGD
ncbi:hypothetical protein SRB5_62580 [Streptomyces sp. RB5]|uniref:Secreted protein n=1 Tax=Streptomyces smaragdinus TaxID=2585196 RepID=A0A7K0CRE5_9ACTN|nr:DUF5719 family protein [Streptomyces smaragdinus]MQY16066.1 hypothetical protein [Streptomyces smaragdinus]